MKGHTAKKPTMDELAASRERMNRASVDFLKIDLETALTFAEIARTSTDPFRKKRNLQAARKAYNAIVHLAQKVDLRSSDSAFLEKRLAQLKRELTVLGETF